MFEILAQIIKNIFYMLYIKTQNSYEKPMSAKEEDECIKRIQQGDIDARNELIGRNLRLVAHIMKKYHINESDYDDLMSIGSIGLIKAADTFKPKKGTRFSTYASRCIENEILMHFRAQKKNSNVLSINDILDTDKEGNELTLIDIISLDDTVSDEVAQKIDIKKMEKLIKTVLTQRERNIIIMRYGLNGKPAINQQDVADRLGISRSYVSRIEKKAIEKLQKEMRL